MRNKIDKEISQELYERIYQIGVIDEKKRIIKGIKQQSKDLRSSMIDKKYCQWNSALKQSTDKLDALIDKLIK